MSAAPLSAFVGREAELARLLAALDEAEQELSPAVVVEGESGAGKTRLLREFAGLAAGRGATVLLGRCIDCSEAGPPFWPFVEALRPLSDADPAELAGAGGQTAGAGGHTAGAGSQATGGPLVTDGRGGEPGGTGHDRARYFTEVLDRLEAAGRRSPVVLLLDDVHWADRSTRDLLGFLLANLAGGPGPLVVMTVRSEALVPNHPVVSLLAELRRSRRAGFMTLGRLGPADVAAQVTSIIGGPPHPDLLDEVWRHSDGNPFFVEELLAAARAGHHLPSTLQPILAARLGALSREGRAAAGAVAAAVGPVGHPLLAGVAGLPDEALLAGLRDCVDHHILVTDSGAGTYAFRHSLLKDAAYADLLPGQAARLHRAYGRALAATLGVPDRPPGAGPHELRPATADPGAAGPAVAELAAVAWHLYAAGEAEQALPAALAAAVAAEAAGGYAEAQVHYERALELAGRLPADALASAFRSALGWLPETVEDAGTGGDNRPSVDRGVGAGEPFDRTALVERAAEVAVLAGDPARSAELVRGALARPVADRSRTQGSDLPAGAPVRDDDSRLHLALGRALWAAGDTEAALAAYDEAVSGLADLETAEGVRALAAAAEAWMLAGRYGKSRRLAEDGLARARRLGLRLEEAEILGTLGADLALLGEAESAVAALDEAVEVATKAGRPRPLARAWLNRAEMLAGPLNRLTEAAGAAAAGLDGLRRLGLDRSYGAALAATLANTLFRSGRWDEAGRVIEAALAARPTGAAAIELLLARARLAVGRGDSAAAGADLDRVDRGWTQAVAPRYRAPLLTLEAGLALWEGRIDDARQAVARALELLDGGDEAALRGGTDDPQPAGTTAPEPVESSDDLWPAGRTDDPQPAGTTAPEPVESSDDVWLVAPVVWHGLRAEGDRADRARATGDRAGARSAADAASALLERARALRGRAAPAVRPVVAAYEVLCRAEAGRTAGANDPEAWADAARRWCGLDQPYPSAYARFREAEAVLAGRSRSARAANALRAAQEVALRLGADPFRREIESLARRARITLPPSPGDRRPGGSATAEEAAVGTGGDLAAGGTRAGAERGARPPGGGVPGGGERESPSGAGVRGDRPAPALPGPLGTLTRREVDVLMLLAEGRTNREIAAGLFISEKTASVHVSHILAKLGVRSRVQAVAVAHRAGIVGHPRA